MHPIRNRINDEVGFNLKPFLEYFVHNYPDYKIIFTSASNALSGQGVNDGIGWLTEKINERFKNKK